MHQPSPAAFEITNSRFQEGAKFLPVAFVCTIISGLWLIYTFYHLTPHEATRAHWEHLDPRTIWIERVAFNVSTFLLGVCYLKCILVHPGTIPDKEEDPHWEYLQAPEQQQRSPYHAAEAAGLGIQQETKRSGDRRSCKWCSKYKPDRCHHCRVCRMCILKMDHHCPWIYNCVGFRNHKFFFLLLFYATIDCHIIMWTMSDSLTAALDNPKTPFMTMFLLLFGETLTAFLGLIISVFFSFHIWLMMKSMTTIEFCEKSMKRMGYDACVYDRGTYGNICSVLGEYPILWLLPCSLPSGNGLAFITDEGSNSKEADGGGGRGRDREPGSGDSRGRRQWNSRSPGRRVRGGRRPGTGGASGPGSTVGSDEDYSGASGRGSLPNSPDRSPTRSVGSMTPPSGFRDPSTHAQDGEHQPLRQQMRPPSVPSLSMSPGAGGSGLSPRRPPLAPGGPTAGPTAGSTAGPPMFAGAAALSPKAPATPQGDPPSAFAKSPPYVAAARGENTNDARERPADW